jgi:predicted TIM-barrel fold metal-dependent hydrolase
VRGFKVYPPCGFSPSDRGLYPFYELCASRGLPATVHMGPTSSALSFEHARPELIDQAARDFPQVNFILAHASVAYVRECVLMAAHRPNVYLDVSAYDAGTPEDLAFMLGRGITHKILFGTDWPVLMMRGTQREALARLCGPGGPAADLSEAESAFFFRENAERIIPGLSAVLAESEAAVVESASHAG